MKRLSSIIALAAVGGAVLVGCAGEDTVNPTPGVPTINAEGGLIQERGLLQDGAGAVAAPQQVQVNVPERGGVVSAWMPANIGANAGQEGVVFFPTFPIIEGLRVEGGQPGTVRVKRQPDGEFGDSGVHVTNDGRLSDELYLPNGQYLVELNGPFTIQRSGNRLDIQKMILEGVVRNGVASVPTNQFDNNGNLVRWGLEGDLPVNGGTTYSQILHAWLPTQFAGGWARLRITHANGVLDHISRVGDNGRVTFGDSNLGDSSLIPANGVLTVEFAYSDNPFVD